MLCGTTQPESQARRSAQSSRTGIVAEVRGRPPLLPSFPKRQPQQGPHHMSANVAPFHVGAFEPYPLGSSVIAGALLRSPVVAR